MTKYITWANGRKAGALGLVYYLGSICFEYDYYIPVSTDTHYGLNIAAIKSFHDAGYEHVSIIRIKPTEG